MLKNVLNWHILIIEWNQRMKICSAMGLVILSKAPNYSKSDRLIGIPFNTFVQLIKHEIKIPNPHYNNNSEYGLALNHDSLLFAILNSSEFITKMENLKMMVKKWREALNHNPNASKPGFPEKWMPGYECFVCAFVMIHTKMVCKNGHSLCGTCSDLFVGKTCPFCKSNVLNPMIKNLFLEEIIKNTYPKQYSQRIFGIKFISTYSIFMKIQSFMVIFAILNI